MILELSLASIFRPHNSYCLHVDSKSDERFQRTVSHILSCYRAKVYWESMGKNIYLIFFLTFYFLSHLPVP